MSSLEDKKREIRLKIVKLENQIIPIQKNIDYLKEKLVKLKAKPMNEKLEKAFRLLNDDRFMEYLEDYNQSYNGEKYLIVDSVQEFIDIHNELSEYMIEVSLDDLIVVDIHNSKIVKLKVVVDEDE
jgi:hypothetical protein